MTTSSMLIALVVTVSAHIPRPGERATPINGRWRVTSDTCPPHFRSPGRACSKQQSLVLRVCLLCGHAPAERPAGRQTDWQHGALGDTCWSLVNVHDKILMIFFCGLGVGRNRKRVGETEAWLPGSPVCRCLISHPGSSPGETAQLGTGKERKPVREGGGAGSLTAPQAEESGNKQKLGYVSIYPTALTSGQITLQFPCLFSPSR